MSKIIQAVRGMNDILPDQTLRYQLIESTLQQQAINYGYREVRFPIVENTLLFKRSIGEVTDIVEKEMYTFDDRNGDSLTLRPEGTAVCVRACLEHGLLHNQEQRLWYSGPMFRHERPQKGRYRQFHQFGVEVFGIATPDIDAELIEMSTRMWEELQIDRALELQLNTLGTKEARAQFRQQLVDYLTRYYNDLDADSQRRLATNPLRILDSKNSQTQAILEDAPRLINIIDNESRTHFEKVCELLDNADVNYVINPKLVRGLDYYGRTAFEWVTTKLGAQGTVCGGGRYDDLVEQLGGRPVPAIGFAIGIERLIELHETQHPVLQDESYADIYVVIDESVVSQAFEWVNIFRDQLRNFRIMMHAGGGQFKNQLKRADKCGARIALIIGPEEIAAKKITVKFLREEKQQQQYALPELIELLARYDGEHKRS